MLTFLLSSMLLLANEVPKSTVSSKEVLNDLLDGNRRFVAGKMMHKHQDSNTRKTLAKSQSPKAIVLSCSDSRVAPELVFDKGLGDIFTVRVAGNILNPENIASIEYSIEHLGSKLIVVMGHESCGAVKASIETADGKSAGSENLDKLVSNIRQNIGKEGLIPNLSDKTFRLPVSQNVLAVVKDLSAKSAIVKAAIEKQEVQVVGAVYSLYTGKVELL